MDSHRVILMAERLSDSQLCTLQVLLLGKVAQVIVHGITYIFARTKEGWMMQPIDDAKTIHTVYADFSACSCPDNRFRLRECKHMKALKELLDA